MFQTDPKDPDYRFKPGWAGKTDGLISGAPGGMAWTGEGGSMPGWREYYMHAISRPAFAKSATVEVQKTIVEIIGEGGTIIPIDGVVYMSLTENGANLSVSESSKEEYLVPGNRRVEISSIEALTKTRTLLFSGVIKEVSLSESWGSRSLFVILGRDVDRVVRYKSVSRRDKTLYRHLLDLAEELGEPDPLPLSTHDYYSSEADVGAGAGVGSKKTIIAGAYRSFAPLAVKTSNISDEASYTTAYNYKEAPPTEGTFEINDSNILGVEKRNDSTAYNAMCVNYISGHSMGHPILAALLVTNEEDVAIRGLITARRSLFAGRMSLGEARGVAESMIAQQLQTDGQYSFEVPFTPELSAGMGVEVNSTKLGINRSGYITGVSHKSGSKATTTVEVNLS